MPFETIFMKSYKGTFLTWVHFDSMNCFFMPFKIPSPLCHVCATNKTELRWCGLIWLLNFYFLEGCSLSSRRTSFWLVNWSYIRVSSSWACDLRAGGTGLRSPCRVIMCPMSRCARDLCVGGTGLRAPRRVATCPHTCDMWTGPSDSW